MIRLALIRHGWTRGNEEGRYIGVTDEPLSQRGIDELRESLESGRLINRSVLGKPTNHTVPVMPTNQTVSVVPTSYLVSRISEAALVVTSPMRRCKETAELLYPGVEVISVPEFREIDFGRFEGKNYRELSGDEEYQRWIDSGGRLPFPGGESREVFVRRTCQGFERLYRRLETRQGAEGGRSGGVEAAVDCKGTVVLIVHGGTIMALLSVFAGGDYFDYRCANGDGFLCVAERVGTEIKLSPFTA